ncbi:MAG: autotransporter domain-containing protein [Puniceicoccales bacterium]|jgi:outer membrane autotransporter protein|nr:autotransporter domain-containing protein [Puniceicoccales bacterium]
MNSLPPSRDSRTGSRSAKRSFCRLFAAAALALASTPCAVAETVYDTVRLTISIGSDERTVDIRLLPDAAPNTAANFKKYVDGGSMVGTFFHRSVTGFVVQGGGFRDLVLNSSTGTATATSATNHGTIKNEYNLHNIEGALAMAKLGGDPDSASNQWFVNINDNRANLDNQNGGFSVFAELATAESLAVFKYINDPINVPVYNKGGAFDSLPLINGTTPVIITKAELVGRDNAVNDRVHVWSVVDGVWDTSDSDNWKIVNGNGVARPFAHWNEALLDNAASENRTITLGEDVGVSDLRIQGDGALVVKGEGKGIFGRVNGYIASSAAVLTKEGANIAVFENAQLDFAGGTDVRAGTLMLTSGTELASPLTVVAPGAMLWVEDAKLSGPLLLRGAGAETRLQGDGLVQGNIFGSGLITAQNTFVNKGLLSPGLGDVTRSAGVISINAPAFRNEGALLLEIETATDHDIIRNVGTGNIRIGGIVYLDASEGYLQSNNDRLDLSIFLESAENAGSIAFDYADLELRLLDVTYLIKEFDRDTGLATFQRDLARIPGIRPDLGLVPRSYARSLNHIVSADGGWLSAYLSSQENPAGAISRLSPLGYASMTAMPLAVASDAANSLRSHLAGLRALHATTPVAPPSEAAAVASAAFPATKPPPFDPTHLSFYVHGNGTFSENGSGNDQPFFDADTYGATVGMDLAMTKRFSAGLNIGLNTGRAQIHDAAGKVRFSQLRVAGYATLSPSDWFYVDGAIHAGFSDFEATRRPVSDAKNDADTRGVDFGGLLHVGSRIPLGKSFSVNPYAGVEFTRATVNGFNESGGSALLPLHIDFFEQYSLRGKAGLEGAWFPTQNLFFSLFASYSHELLDSEAAIKGRFLEFSGMEKFKIKAPSTSEGILQAGLQFTQRLHTNVTVSLGYAYSADLDSMTAHTVSANFQWKF